MPGQPSSKPPAGRSEATAERALSSSSVKIGSHNKAINLRLLCILGVIDGADLQLLPVCFRALEVDLGLGPKRLAWLALCQGVACAVSGPFWGNVADNGGSRKSLLVLGAAGWGIATMMLAYLDSFPAMVVLRIFNGIALGTLSPVVQSLIADEVEPYERGFYFGCLGFCRTAIGMVATTLVVTTVSNQTYWGISGWRLAFAVVGAVSIFIALVFNRLFEEPRRELRISQVSFVQEFRKLWGYCRNNSTFMFILVEGMFGCLPFAAMSFQTMFFQYMSIADTGVAAITALSTLGCGVGYALGGIIGDFFVRYLPDHGRVLTAQASMTLSIPLAAFIYTGVSHETSQVTLFAVLCFVLGLVSSWCDAGCNRPIFTEIVPAASRASAFSWLYCLEWSFSQCFGLTAVAYMSEACFGYKPQREQVYNMPVEVRLANADALGRSLLLSSVVPWTIALFIYSLVYFSYKGDREKAEASESTHLCSLPLSPR